jgi:phage host-nuclease inhibitor protein Gam
MDISFNCKKCGQHIVIDEDGAGQLVDCPKCGTTLEVPYKADTLAAVASSTPAPRKPSVPPPAQHTPGNRPVSNRKRVLVALGLVTVIAVTLIFAARRLFIPPTVDGEAFLVMKSLDVKKLADLKVYLLRDPYPALAEVNKAVTDQYSQARKTAAQSDPAIRYPEERIASLKTELASLDGEKQKKLAATNRDLDATLKQLNADLENLKSTKLDVENQVTALEQQPTRVEYEKLKRARSDIEARYAPSIQQAEAESNSAERTLQDYIARALAAAAKLINDHILARNLTVDLVPKDGRFKKDYSLADNYESEIFETKKDYGFTVKDEFGWLGVKVKADESESLSEYATFTKFPTSLTDNNLRQTFISYYQAYAKQRSGLEAARDAAAKKLTATTEGRRLTLQKFDYQDGTRMQSLETQVQANESQIGLLKTKLDSLTDAIGGKETVLSKPPAEQVASLRAEIEKSFADRRVAIKEELASAEASLAPLMTDALSRQSTRIRDSAESKTAEAIASKIVASATADSDGRFAFRPPSTGEFVVYARTQTGNEETIYWFEKVKVGLGKATIKLSNSNLVQPQP